MNGKFALIIGNTEYTDPGLAQLTAPGRDAKDFGRVLDSPEIGAFDDVITLVNENATKVNEAIDYFFSLKKPDDLLVLYFSGHGVRDEYGSLYLAVKNTNRARLRSTAIKSDFIREAMDQSRSKRQVLILDCCNSGAFAQGTKAETGGSVGTASAFEGTGYGRVVLTASDSTQFAWEGDKVIGETDNSLFTHFLVKGLEGDADNDGDGKITVDELYDYAYEQIINITPKQTPGKWSYKQQGEIVLRQSTRIENIKSLPLSAELMDEIEDTRPYVREAAVQKLEKILKGKNIGMARSAKEALEKIVADENTTRRVAQAAMQILESIRQKVEDERLAAEKTEVEHKAEEARIALARIEADHLAEEKLLAAEKVETERKVKEEAERVFAIQSAEEERLAKAKIETKRLAEEKRLSAEKVETERTAKEKAEQLLTKQWAEDERLTEERRIATEKVAGEKAGREIERLKAERETEENIAKEKVEKAIKGDVVQDEKELSENIDESVYKQIKHKRQQQFFVRFTIYFIIIPLILFWLVFYVPYSISNSLLAITDENANKITQIVKRNNLWFSPITSVAFSPDGNILAFGSENNTIRLWRASDGILLYTLVGQSGVNGPPVITTVGFSRDGNTLASGSSDGVIQIWRVRDGMLLQTFQSPGGSVYSVAFSPESNMLASGDASGVHLLQTSDGSLFRTLEGYESAPGSNTTNSVAFSPDGTTLAAGSQDHTVRTWRVSDGILLLTLNGNLLDITSVAFSPDGTILASGSNVGGIDFWRVSDGTLIQNIETDSSERIAFSPNGLVLAGMSFQSMSLWRVNDGFLLQTVSRDYGFSAFSPFITFSPSGKLLASGSGDGTIRLWGIAP